MLEKQAEIVDQNNAVLLEVVQHARAIKALLSVKDRNGYDSRRTSLGHVLNQLFVQAIGNTPPTLMGACNEIVIAAHDVMRMLGTPIPEEE